MKTRRNKDTKASKYFHKLPLGKNGRSVIECRECGKNARWISQDGHFLCDKCKKAYKKIKTCSACGTVL